MAGRGSETITGHDEERFSEMPYTIPADQAQKLSAMKKTLLPLCCGIIGLLIGLAWKPYTLEIQRLGQASAIIKMNRITGASWQLLPGDDHWEKITTRRAGEPAPRTSARERSSQIEITGDDWLTRHAERIILGVAFAMIVGMICLTKWMGESQRTPNRRQSETAPPGVRNEATRPEPPSQPGGLR